MRLGGQNALILIMLCLLMVCAISTTAGGEEKRIMIAVTGDTQGEINPCG